MLSNQKHENSTLLLSVVFKMAIIYRHVLHTARYYYTELTRPLSGRYIIQTPTLLIIHTREVPLIAVQHYQFSLPQIEHTLGGTSKMGSNVYFLLIVAMVLLS